MLENLGKKLCVIYSWPVTSWCLAAVQGWDGVGLIAYNCAQADKPGKAVQERELGIASWHCENTAAIIPLLWKSFLRCVSEKLGVKEFLSRVTSSVRPVNCGWSWMSYCLVSKAYDMTTGFIA